MKMASTRAKVLIIDDEKSITDLLSDMLGDNDFLTVSFNDAELAMDYLNVNSVDVILVDLILPKMSGMEILEDARRIDPDVEVVMMTGYATLETAVEAMQKGAYGYLKKPFDINEVVTEVAKAAEKHELKTLLALHEASKSIFSSIELNELLRNIIEQVAKVLKADESSIMLFDDEDHLYIAASSGLQSQVTNDTRVALCESISGKIAIDKKPVILPFPTDDSSELNELCRREDIKSSIVHPIIAKNKVFGVLNLNRTKIGESFNLSDLQKASLFVSMMAQSIESANLYSDLEKKIEELNQAYRKLQSQQEKIVQSEKLTALGKMIGGISHEINNPLTIILGFSEYMIKSADSEKDQETLKKIFDSAQRCRKIINNLVCFGQPRTAEKRTIKIDEIIEDVIEMANYDLRSHNIEIKKEFEKEMPRIMADPEQLKDVFSHAIDNAIFAVREKNGPSGSSIVVRAGVRGRRILVQITDNGTGIKKSDMNNIFDPFFTTKEVGAGHGLGLSTAYGIVKDHGGEISASSVDGEGATISIELPYQPGTATSRERVVISKTKIGHKKNILVVDDENFISDLCCTILEEFGHQVEVAQNGRIALEKINKKQYDLVLLDVKMPDITGIEVYEEVMKSNPEQARRILFSTGDTVSDDTHGFFEKTGAPYISKPFKVAQLMETVNRHIS
jgi:signal transduction histidine kinase/DNA-binding response OmpR family regulator